MSLVSETEQHLMDSGSDEEQNDGSGEVESEIESDNKQQEDLAEFDSEDDNDEVDSDDDETVKGKTKSSKKEIENPNKPKSNGIKKLLQNNEEEEKEKCLFVHLPYVLPDQETLERTAKELCYGVTRVHRPLHGHSQSCFIYFDCIENLYEARRELMKVQIEGNKVYVSKPRYTSTINVQNIPSKSTISAIKELFPNTSRIDIYSAKGEDPAWAKVKLFGPLDAAIAKQIGCKIGENVFNISYEHLKKIQYNKSINLKHKAYQGNGQAADGSPNSKISKRKLEESLSIESSSPKKNKRDANKKTEKQIESKGKEKSLENIKKKEPKEKEKDLENVKKKESKEKQEDSENMKKKTFKKELDIKDTSKAGNKHSDAKEIKQKKNLKKNDTNPCAKDTEAEKKKVKNDKIGKPLKLKSPKVK